MVLLLGLLVLKRISTVFKTELSLISQTLHFRLLTAYSAIIEEFLLVLLTLQPIAELVCVDVWKITISMSRVQSKVSFKVEALIILSEVMILLDIMLLFMPTLVAIPGARYVEIWLMVLTLLMMYYFTVSYFFFLPLSTFCGMALKLEYNLVHHAFVDKTWWRWQNLCDGFKHSYDGLLSASDPTNTDPNFLAFSSQNLDSLPWTVAQVLDTQGDVLCYTYSQGQSDLPLSKPANCPDAAARHRPPHPASPPRHRLAASPGVPLLL